MPRRREVPKRTILPDPKFGDQTLTKTHAPLTRSGDLVPIVPLTDSILSI